MKSKLKLSLLLLIIITLISTFSFATEATEATENVILSTDNTATDTSTETQDAINSQVEDWVSSDVYEIGDVVELNKIVDGNVFIMAKEVTIDTEIGGDVFVMAQKVTITDNAYIYSGLFAMANEININGIVCDAYVLANNLNIGENGYVYRDLKASVNTIDINGKIRRNAELIAANYNLNSENGLLIGDLNYTGTSEITVPEGAVQGSVNFNKQEVKEVSVGTKVLSYVFSAINSLIFALAIVLLSIWLAPKFVEKVTNMDAKKALISLGIGLLFPIAGIIAIFLLLLSSIASSFAIFAGLVLVAVCMSGTAFASIYFGGLFAKLLKWEGKGKLIACSAISALAIWLISQIPFIGGFFGLLVSILGIGILVTNVIKSRKSEE